MIIKNNSTRLFVTFSFFLIIPFAQKQWLNLYLFNISDISFYSFLYYLSGIICPFLIGLNSLNNYTYYKFNKHKNTRKKTIIGRTLLFLVVINLIFLSFLITEYLYINFDFICSLFLEGIKLQPDIYQLSFFILLISVLLIFKKPRLLLKKLVIINFVLISFFIWFLQINNIKVDDQFHIYKYFGSNGLNLINLFILVFIDISFYTWSFLSYKTNLSDWIVPKPQKGDLIPILNMFIFYFFIIIYYLILT